MSKFLDESDTYPNYAEIILDDMKPKIVRDDGLGKDYYTSLLKRSLNSDLEEINLYDNSWWIQYHNHEPNPWKDTNMYKHTGVQLSNGKMVEKINFSCGSVVSCYFIGGSIIELQKDIRILRFDIIFRGNPDGKYWSTSVWLDPINGESTDDYYYFSKFKNTQNYNFISKSNHKGHFAKKGSTVGFSSDSSGDGVLLSNDIDVTLYFISV